MEKKRFEFYQDVKVVIWKRQHFVIEAETEQEAEEIAKGCAGMDISCVEDIEVEDVEYLSEHEEQVLVSENDGYATIEVWKKGNVEDSMISFNQGGSSTDEDCLFEQEVVLHRL